MAVCLTVYDGAGCIGGNRILLEDGDAALMLDFGTNFKSEGSFFDEFLQPRATFGFSDLLALGLLPPLRGLYRSDLEYPGIWEKYAGHHLYRDVEVQGVILSHAHFDHCGHFTYLRQDLPVYTSLTSAAICKSLQDTGTGEICYVLPREFKDGLIRTADYRRFPAGQRSFRAFGCDSIAPEAAAFWKRCNASRELECCPLQACNDETEIAGLIVHFWPVDHSVPGAGAFGIRTSAGWVVYTGDIRLHGKNARLSRRFIEEAARLKPVALICEGTHPETKRPVSEEEVASNCFEVVNRTDGLMVADFGPRNVERLLSFLEIAGETGRRLVLTSKDVYLLDAVKSAGLSGVPDPFTDDRIGLYVRPKAMLKKWEECLLASFKDRCPDRLVNSASVRACPGDYILCFSYYDFHAFLDIEPESGSYIYSSCEAFDEEMLIDHQRIKNWIDFFGFELYGTLGRDREKSGFHASGHIHGPGIEELVETIKPDVLVPVHTESRDFFRRFEKRCKVVFPAKGRKIMAG